MTSIGRPSAEDVKYASANLLNKTELERSYYTCNVQNKTGVFGAIASVLNRIWFNTLGQFGIWVGHDVKGADTVMKEYSAIKGLKNTREELMSALAIATIMPANTHDTRAVIKAQERVDRKIDAYFSALKERASQFKYADRSSIFQAGKQEISNAIKAYNEAHFKDEKGIFFDKTNDLHIPDHWMKEIVSPRLATNMLAGFITDLTPKAIKEAGLDALVERAQLYIDTFAPKGKTRESVVLHLQSRIAQKHGTEFATAQTDMTSEKSVKASAALVAAPIEKALKSAQDAVTFIEGNGTDANPGQLAKARIALKDAEQAKHLMLQHLLVEAAKVSSVGDESNDTLLLGSLAKILNLSHGDARFINAMKAIQSVIVEKSTVTKLEQTLQAAKDTIITKSAELNDVINQVSQKNANTARLLGFFTSPAINRNTFLNEVFPAEEVDDTKPLQTTTPRPDSKISDAIFGFMGGLNPAEYEGVNLANAAIQARKAEEPTEKSEVEVEEEPLPPPSRSYEEELIARFLGDDEATNAQPALEALKAATDGTVKVEEEEEEVPFILIEPKPQENELDTLINAFSANPSSTTSEMDLLDFSKKNVDPVFDMLDLDFTGSVVAKKPAEVKKESVANLIAGFADFSFEQGAEALGELSSAKDGQEATAAQAKLLADREAARARSFAIAEQAKAKPLAEVNAGKNVFGFSIETFLDNIPQVRVNNIPQVRVARASVNSHVRKEKMIENPQSDSPFISIQDLAPELVVGRV